MGNKVFHKMKDLKIEHKKIQKKNQRLLILKEKDNKIAETKDKRVTVRKDLILKAAVAVLKMII